MKRGLKRKIIESEPQKNKLRNFWMKILIKSIQIVTVVTVIKKAMIKEIVEMNQLLKDKEQPFRPERY